MTVDESEQSLLTQALACINSGQWAKAARKLIEITDRNPSHDAACHFLGLCYFEQGDTSRARQWIDKAIAVNPNNQQYFNNLALVLSADGNDEAALTAANRAAFLAPDNPDTQTTRGVMLQRFGRLSDAAAAYDIALSLAPNHTQALINAASLEQKAERYGGAEAFYHRALDANPRSIDALLGLGKSQAMKGDINAAIQTLEKGRRVHADSPQFPMAIADLDLKRHETAAAVQVLESAAQQFPSNPAVWNNLGYALRDLPDTEKAQVALEHALALNPLLDSAADNLGQIFLSLGKFREGWPLYRRRNVKPPPSIGALSQTCPSPDGLPTEKPIVVWTEQGLGDELLQAGLITDLRETCANLTVLCSDRVLALFVRSFPGVDVRSRETGRLDVNTNEYFCSPLIDMANDLRPTVARFPQHEGYLSPNMDLMSSIRQRYLRSRPAETILVGISWFSGNKLYGDANTIPLRSWGPLFATAEAAKRPVTFVACQYEAMAEEVERAAKAHRADVIFDESVDLTGDLDEAVAQVAAMDLVITTSTTTAQIGGAIGMPTIHMTSSGLACGWYWMHEGASTPWYPAMTIIRCVDGKPSQVQRTSEILIETLRSLEAGT